MNDGMARGLADPSVLTVKPASANPDNQKKKYTIIVDGDAWLLSAGGPPSETAGEDETMKTRDGQTILGGHLTTDKDTFQVDGQIVSVEDESGKIELVSGGQTISSPGNHIGGDESAGGDSTAAGGATGAFYSDIMSKWNDASMPTKVVVGLGGLGAVTFVGTQMLPE